MTWERHEAPLLRRYWRRLSALAKFAIIGLCLLLLAGVAYGIQYSIPTPVPPDHYCMRQGSTVLLHSGPNGECVGFTDGTYVYAPALSAIEGDIQREDQLVARTQPSDSVAVVYLLPISSADGSILSMANVAEQLRGAYVAQYYANRNDVDGIRPYIRLLIGNLGFQADQWPPAASIIEGAVTEQHIAAVAGIGVSLSTTQDAAYQLTSHGIPVIGATITSDNFDNIKNLIRVSPSNQEEISVAVSYIKSQYTRAFLVEDENSGDTYDTTLVSGFQDFADATHQIVGKDPYDTTTRDEAQTGAEEAQAEAVVENRLSQMTTDICAAQPAAVLFAGRGRDLAELVADLANRPCLNTPITIISGDDVTNMPISARVTQGLASDVTVDFVGVATPGEWSDGSGTAVSEGRQGFATFYGDFQKLFPGAPLSDGNTMMAYDATLTGVSAIRLTSSPQPPPYAVAGEFGALQGARTVLGASGPLAFNPDYRNSDVGSDPVGKAIPILRLGAEGTPHFLQLTWPDGEPPAY
jgi:ABC-type branched-subunit amino acid transport system substrate-binding protein